jgi:2-amino-4-hydroxy-6-hydroxymethyldihydropteridine diphosphokinase
MPENEDLNAKLSRAFIGLGSNIEPRLGYLQRAVTALGELGEVVRISSVYETVPVGGVPQPDYLNAVLELLTTMNPIDLIQSLKAIELQLGRVERPRWHEREIDLDLLLYDDIVLRIPGITIPHSEFQNRAFVILPMIEIAQNVVHPVLGRSISELKTEIIKNDVRKTELTLKIS